MNRSARQRAVLLALARRVARRCARRHPLALCASDRVVERLERYGHASFILGRVAPSIFRTREWALTSLRVRSSLPRSRGREIKVWRHKDCGSSTNAGGVVWPDPRATAIRVESYSKSRREPASTLSSCKLCNDVFPPAIGHVRDGEWYCGACLPEEE